MYQLYDDILTITVNDWCRAGLSKNVFENDSKRGDLAIYKRGINGNTLINVRSIKRPERLRVIEAAFGKVNEKAQTCIFKMEIDDAARQFYIGYRVDGEPLDADKIKEYTNRASILTALKKGLAKQIMARAKGNRRVKMGEFYTLAVNWYNEQTENYPCRPAGNVRAFERAFKQYLNEGYMAVIHKNIGNDAARIVSDPIEKLLLSIWRTNDKPFISRVHELYCEFVSGSRELYDKSTGEVFRPDEFRHKGRAVEISLPTVWNYLKDVVNNTAVYADRNGNFDYANSQRPKHHRKLGKCSLSKISMDDSVLSRKSVRGWVARYHAVDVVSGYWFRPAYIVGKPTLNTVTETFRNMFCELTELGLPIPGELEVEYHLMKDISWLNDIFKFVRFCNSPTEKRAEHSIKSLKYGTAKDAGHTRGRWYAKREAFRSVRNKVDGDFIEPEFQPQTIVADDLADIEKHNNELHPLQKTYPGMTRREVMLAKVNPILQPVEHWYLYQYIGNETVTSIHNNDFCPVQNGEFELTDFTCLKRLKSNNTEVKAYWLPETDGSIKNVYLYQGETYIGEAVNRSAFDYNECAIERTEEDEANILHQNRRTAKFDKFIKEQKEGLVKIGHQTRESVESALAVEVEIMPSPEKAAPALLNNFDFETKDWAAQGRASL